MHIKKTFLFMLLVLLCFSPTNTPIIDAQGGDTLSYGTSTTGAITPDVPLMFYTFSGTQGDLVRIDVYGLSDTLIPTTALINPGGQAIASSQPDPFAENHTDPFIAHILPETGVYSISVGGTNGTSGLYVLQLAGRRAIIPTRLVYDEAVTVPIGQNSPPQYFDVIIEDCPTTLIAYEPPIGDPFTFPYIAKLRDEARQEIAMLRGGESVEGRVTVPALSGNYEVEVWADDPLLTGELSLLVICEDTETLTCPGGDAGEGPEDACPDCPPCEEDPICEDFDLRVEFSEEDDITVSWPPVEGANAAIVSLEGEVSGMLYARLVNDTLTDTIALRDLDAPTDLYRIIVSVGSEELGYDICRSVHGFEYLDDGPVDWGPAADDDEEPEDVCAVNIVAPLETMANGLQTFFWNNVPEAESYWLRIYGQFDAVVAEGVISAPATSMTLDVSEASIGVGYGGENDFYVQIDARAGDERLCANGARVTRNP